MPTLCTYDYAFRLYADCEGNRRTLDCYLMSKIWSVKHVSSSHTNAWEAGLSNIEGTNIMRQKEHMEGTLSREKHTLRMWLNEHRKIHLIWMCGCDDAASAIQSMWWYENQQKFNSLLFNLLLSSARASHIVLPSRPTSKCKNVSYNGYNSIKPSFVKWISDV